MTAKGTGVLLRSPDGATFRFDPGALCLEFAVTGGDEDQGAFETLRAPVDLERWAESTLDLVMHTVTMRDLVEARRLRAAVWRLADARIARRVLGADDVDALNRSAARPPLVPRIDDQGRRVFAAPATATQLLSTVARDAVDLFTGPFANRIRRCSGTNCTLVFVDTSRPGRRRWCSMERCGNRAKVNTFRQRQRKEDQP
ncbi:MAG: CGNR zinc finger domain-containing protein [Actinomycetota bacterium]|nr:CGNR zinc finger domain-containing protein [Actinomycetota bacterium]